MAPSATISRINRPVDIGPSCNVRRADDIGVSGVPTALTNKLSLRLTVALFAVSALWTSTASVSRINRLKRDAREPTFVLEKSPEFKKRPACQVIPHRFFNLYPFGYPCQIFSSDAQTVVFSGGNDSLTDHVIYVFGKTGFFARKLLKLALSRLRTALLQAFAKASILTAYPFNLCAAVGLTIRGRCNFYNTHINAKVALNLFRCRVRDAARRQKKELTPDVNQVRLALLELQEFQLTLTPC